MCQSVVLILKGEEDYLIIGLAKVVWTVVLVILNCRFTTSIAFHDVLHGLWAGCGTGTISLKENLLQQ